MTNLAFKFLSTALVISSILGATENNECFSCLQNFAKVNIKEIDQKEDLRMLLEDLKLLELEHIYFKEVSCKTSKHIAKLTREEYPYFDYDSKNRCLMLSKSCSFPNSTEQYYTIPIEIETSQGPIYAHIASFNNTLALADGDIHGETNTGIKYEKEGDEEKTILFHDSHITKDLSDNTTLSFDNTSSLDTTNAIASDEVSLTLEHHPSDSETVDMSLHGAIDSDGNSSAGISGSYKNDDVEMEITGSISREKNSETGENKETLKASLKTKF